MLDGGDVAQRGQHVGGHEPRELAVAAVIAVGVAGVEAGIGEGGRERTDTAGACIAHGSSGISSISLIGSGDGRKMVVTTTTTSAAAGDAAVVMRDRHRVERAVHATWHH